MQWGTTNFTGWKQEFNGNVYLSQTISWWCDRMFNSILLNNFWGEIEMNAAGAATAAAAPAAALARRWTGESSRSKAAAAPRLRADTQLGQIAKARQKWDFKKIVKLTDHTCAYNDLTNFEYEAGNRKRKFWKLAWKISWIHLGWSYFLAGFQHMEPLCDSTCVLQVRRRRRLWGKVNSVGQNIFDKMPAQTPNTSTTTISTVVLQRNSTTIVIALLQSGIHIHLKVNFQKNGFHKAVEGLGTMD